MSARCDLHTHSTYSDGTCTPAELIRLAQQAGLSAVALSDHNTMSGVPAFLEAARDSSVQAIAGIEFSTEYWDVELHILGLFIQPRYFDEVEAVAQQYADRKEKSNVELVAALAKAGIVLDYDAIKAGADGRINRAVLGAEMVRLGYCASVKQAFSDWLSVKKGYYVPPVRPDALEIIRFIKSIGAVAVFAHPFLSYDEAQLRAFLPLARQAGLDGMEVYYPVYDAANTATALELAEAFDLLKSGGSDFHGENKPDIAIGTGKGSLCVPMSFADALRARAIHT